MLRSSEEPKNLTAAHGLQDGEGHMGGRVAKPSKSTLSIMAWGGRWVELPRTVSVPEISALMQSGRGLCHCLAALTELGQLFLRESHSSDTQAMLGSAGWLSSRAAFRISSPCPCVCHRRAAPAPAIISSIV